MDEEILAGIAKQLNEQLSKTIRETLESSIEREVQKSLGKALIDGEFYQTMTNEVQTGLNQLMSEIQNLKTSMDIQINSPNETPGDIFSYAADKLNGIYNKTEDATIVVMDIVENQINLVTTTKKNQKNIDSTQLSSLLDTTNDNMFQILTALSFQDIIGLQIKSNHLYKEYRRNYK